MGVFDTKMDAKIDAMKTEATKGVEEAKDQIKTTMEQQNAMFNIFMQKLGSSSPDMTANEPTRTNDRGSNTSGNENCSQDDGKTPSKFKKKQAIAVTPPENGRDSKINAETKMNIDSDEEFEKNHRRSIQ